MLLLEEPEAHVFPYYLDMLANYIAKAKEFLYVVIASHNPMLISMLWDKNWESEDTTMLLKIDTA